MSLDKRLKTIKAMRGMWGSGQTEGWHDMLGDLLEGLANDIDVLQQVAQASLREPGSIAAMAWGAGESAVCARMIACATPARSNAKMTSVMEEVTCPGCLKLMCRCEPALGTTTGHKAPCQIARWHGAGTGGSVTGRADRTDGQPMNVENVPRPTLKEVCKVTTRDARIGDAFCDLPVDHNGEHHDKEKGVVWWGQGGKRVPWPYASHAQKERIEARWACREGHPLTFKSTDDKGQVWCIPCRVWVTPREGAEETVLKEQDWVAKAKILYTGGWENGGREVCRRVALGQGMVREVVELAQRVLDRQREASAGTGEGAEESAVVKGNEEVVRLAGAMLEAGLLDNPKPGENTVDVAIRLLTSEGSEG